MTGSTIVIRLRAYRGSQMDTTECFNGLRDEAADALERAEAEVERMRADAERWNWATHHPDKASQMLCHWDLDGAHSVDDLNQAVGLEMDSAPVEGRRQG